MELFRGYIQTQGKQPLEKFKGRKNLSTLADVQGLDEYAGVLGNETILIDVDDAPTSDILYQIVQDLKLKCRVYQDGIYQSGTEAISKAMVKIMPGIKKAQRSEVMDYLNIICEERFPAKPTLIAFQNGIYDLESDSFKDFTPNIVITNQIPWPYNPAAYSEPLDQTLNRISCHDPEVRALLEEMVGSTFYRSNNLGGGKAFMLSGEGRNGKSTLLKLLQATLSYKNIASLELKQLTEKFTNAELFGKLANIGDDIGAEFISDASTFRKLVTGERIQVQRKGQDPFEFSNYAKLIFSANDIPRIGGAKDSIAVERRIVVIPFDAKFTPDDPDFDPEIIDKLKNQEAFEYLILLGLKGLKRVRANSDYSKCAAASKAKEEYVIENNPVLSFLAEQDEDDIVNEPTSEVYKLYKAFCYTGNYQPLTPITFSKQVCKALNLYTKQQRVKALGGKNCQVFLRKEEM